MRKLLRPTALALVLALIAIGLIGALSVHSPREARAQNTQLVTQTVGGQISIAAGTPAVLITNTTTGSSAQKIVVTGMKLATVSTGGIVQFYNGTANPATTGLTFVNGNPFAAYVPASTSVNNNVEIGANILPQQGTGVLATTAGNHFAAQLNGCTLVYEISYFYQ